MHTLICVCRSDCLLIMKNKRQQKYNRPGEHLYVFVNIICPCTVSDLKSV
jgi:hypothetical protein